MTPDVINILAIVLPLMATMWFVHRNQKADNESLRAEMKADNANLRAEMKADNARLQTEMTEIKAELADLNKRLAILSAEVSELGGIVSMIRDVFVSRMKAALSGIAETTPGASA